MNIHDFIQIGGAQADLAISVEQRPGRMPVSSVQIAEIGGSPHLVWVSADGEEEGISMRSDASLVARSQDARGLILVEFDQAGLIESSAQVVRAEPEHNLRERCHG